MKFKITTEVIIDEIGKITDIEVMVFPDNSNVFDRILKYHERIWKKFSYMVGFELIEAKEMNE